jgi:peptidoglycan/xylan/chitin deacetylase (PgdA/CDA1 family)
MRRVLAFALAAFLLGCVVGVGIWAVIGRSAVFAEVAGGSAAVTGLPSPAQAPSTVPATAPPDGAVTGSGAPSPSSPPGDSASASTIPAAASPTPAPYHGPTTRIVPVLMYHRIADPPPGAPYPGLYVSPASFDAQMQALHDAGWRSITAGELGADMAADRPVPVRTFVATFDDGYADNYAVAFPILVRYGFRATFSVVARGGSTMMTSQELATMVAAGMEIGNHTLDHRNVSRLSGQMLDLEIEGGALRIETRLATQGVTVNPRTFVYPSGHVGPAALALLAQLGYTDAFTEVPGFAVIGQTPPLQIPRVRVSRFETLAAFLAGLPVEPHP